MVFTLLNVLKESFSIIVTIFASYTELTMDIIQGHTKILQT